jgi:hypothetical protein
MDKDEARRETGNPELDDQVLEDVSGGGTENDNYIINNNLTKPTDS